MGYCILGNSWNREGEGVSRPDFFIDLNLDQVIDRVLDKRKNYECKDYYYELPKRLETVRFRQSVFEDLEKETLYRGMLSFSDEMRMAREFKEYSRKSMDDLQKKRWHLDSTYHYGKAVQVLHLSLLDGKPSSQGLVQLKDMVEELTKGEAFQGLLQSTNRLREEFDRMRVHVELTPDKMVISREVPDENYLERMVRLFPNTQGLPDKVENPFTNILKLSHMERKILEVFQKNVPEAFMGLHEYYKKYKDCMEPFLLQLEREVQFYLAFILYRETMLSLGCFFAMPCVYGMTSAGVLESNKGDATDRKACFQIQDAYDLALAWNVYSGKHFSKNVNFGKNDGNGEGKVVSNDAFFKGKERFFVVTGPNQGGKTTFARSVGQVVYFALMGLPAPCMQADIPMFSGILTHFSVEESMETGKGKLKEELTRLKPMMNPFNRNQFVIINELFTTAATYDAYIMGNRVMKHFIKSDCYGVYVTHIQELAGESEEVVSLVAELDAKDKRIRTFQMVRRKAMEEGYANAIVDKYHLNYEEIKERLK